MNDPLKKSQQRNSEGVQPNNTELVDASACNRSTIALLAYNAIPSHPSLPPRKRSASQTFSGSSVSAVEQEEQDTAPRNAFTASDEEEQERYRAQDPIPTVGKEKESSSSKKARNAFVASDEKEQQRSRAENPNPTVGKEKESSNINKALEQTHHLADTILDMTWTEKNMAPGSSLGLVRMATNLTPVQNRNELLFRVVDDVLSLLMEGNDSEDEDVRFQE